MAERVFVFDPAEEARLMEQQKRQQEYWFYAKSFGCGWSYPSRAEGWVFAFVMTAIWIAGITAFFLLLEREDTLTLTLCYVGGTAVWVAVLISVCYWKGDPKGRECNFGL